MVAPDANPGFNGDFNKFPLPLMRCLNAGIIHREGRRGGLIMDDLTWTMDDFSFKRAIERSGDRAIFERYYFNK